MSRYSLSCSQVLFLEDDEIKCTAEEDDTVIVEGIDEEGDEGCDDESRDDENRDDDRRDDDKGDDGISADEEGIDDEDSTYSDEEGDSSVLLGCSFWFAVREPLVSELIHPIIKTVIQINTARVDAGFITSQMLNVYYLNLIKHQA